MIGPNGSGKSTCINMLSGVLRPSEGRIFFEGEDISRKKPHEIVNKGLVRTFQASVIYDSNTVEENVIRGFHCEKKLRLQDAFFESKKRRDKEKKISEAVDRHLEFVGLHEVKNETAGSLPYGHQKLLQIAIALGCKPKVLLLDEPSTGLNPKETMDLMKIIGALKEREISILLVAHDVRMVMTLSDNIVVMNYGTKIAEGKASEIKKSPEVIRAYLGEYNEST